MDPAYIAERDQRNAEVNHLLDEMVERGRRLLDEDPDEAVLNLFSEMYNSDLMGPEGAFVLAATAVVRLARQRTARQRP